MAIKRPSNIVANARYNDWTAARLQPCFPTVEPRLIQKLLDGSAIIVEGADPSKFQIYEPTVERSPM